MAAWRAFPFLSMILATALFAGGTAMAKSVTLPPKAPVPQPSERPAEAPLDKPAEIPIPPPKPADAVEPGKPADTAKEPEKKTRPADPRSAVLPQEKLPAEEMACRARLKALGVEFEERKAESDPAIGCAIPYPLMLRTLGKAIGIEPDAEMNCRMAVEAAAFVAKTIMPAAKTHFGSELKSIDQASAYVCRPRHNGEKMSEHAFGNALDIANFTLADGTKIAVEPKPPEKNAKFLDEVRKAACGPFKTVLGPGADPDHALHFHLDLEPRRNGGTFCQ